MITDCCTKDESIDDVYSDSTANGTVFENCRTCGTKGALVSTRTVLLMLKSDLLEQASTKAYRFCAGRDCPTVYFEESGSHTFSIDDLRVRVGVKSDSDPIPLCYCFGFDESHLRDEIANTGSTTIPIRISNLIREGLCACEARNPSGGCCLGEVNRAEKRLLESKQSESRLTKTIDVKL